MASVSESMDRYEMACKSDKLDLNRYIIRVLEILEENDTEDAVDRLYLSGSNYLITKNRLLDQDIEPLCKSLESNFYFRVLDLPYNKITDKGAVTIGQLLKVNTYLFSINLMGNDIGPKGGETIAESLQVNETLKSICMTGNKIGRKGGMAFAQCLQVNKSLENLDLSDCDITIDVVIALSTVLHYNGQIKSLNISRPLLRTVQEEPTVHVSKMLKVNSTLLELHMEKYDMRDFGAARLSDTLVSNFTLTYLNLSSNRITRDGMKQISNVLKADTALRYLDLSNNRLEDPGAISLAEALTTYNTHLETILVRFNNIGGKGLCALADALKFNKTITSIFVWGNNFEESACIAFNSLVRYDRISLENTDVKPYVVDGVTLVAELDQKPKRHYYSAPYWGGENEVPAIHRLFAKFVREHPDFEQIEEVLQEARPPTGLTHTSIPPISEFSVAIDSLSSAAT